MEGSEFLSNSIRIFGCMGHLLPLRSVLPAHANIHLRSCFRSYTLLHPMIFDIYHNMLRPSYIWLCSRNLLVKIAFPSNGYFGFTRHSCFFSTLPGLKLLKESGFVSVA